ncbi:MAG TPA: TAXI family TRAP transporter solute-binding subunit [Thermodesulfobacteriota bacterium]
MRRRVALLVLGFAGAAALAIAVVPAGPPSRLVLAAGRPDGAYYRFALRYRDLLAGDHVTLEVRATSGAAENVALLADPESGVDVAFVQGGVRAPEGAPLVALGSLFYEPLWLVARDGSAGQGLAGRRLAIGPTGSGTRAVAETILDAAGIDTRETPRSSLTGMEATEALRAGTVDGVFLIASPRSPALQALVRVPGATLATIPRSPAYARRFPYLTTLLLPAGTLDLENDIPAEDTVLLATTAALAVRSDFHPALVNLLLMTADRVHGGPGLFERRNEFPSPDHLDLPLAEEARRFYDSGPPLLIRHLPFSAAMLVTRLKVLLPVLPLAFGLYQFLPGLYRGRVRARIHRWYRDVHDVDVALASRPSAAVLRELGVEVDRIDEAIRTLRVPLGYEELRYHLCAHVNLVRERVRAALADAEASGRETRAAGPRTPAA